MSKVKFLLVLMIIGLLGTYGYVQSGLFNIAATVKDGPLLTWLLHTTMEKSVEKHAAGTKVPELGDKEMILDGVSDYVGMCALCHGEPGGSPDPVRQGLNPNPPELGNLAQLASPAEMFWIISNGIRMSGMPAFGKTHDPDEIWPVVAFVQSARNITDADYARLKLESRGHRHHHDGEMDDEDHDQHQHNPPDTGSAEQQTGMEHHHEQAEMEPGPADGKEDNPAEEHDDIH